MGMLFLSLGLFIVLNERYTIEKVDHERNMVKKPGKKNYQALDSYKILLSIFALILGIFCIINYFFF